MCFLFKCIYMRVRVYSIGNIEFNWSQALTVSTWLLDMAIPTMSDEPNTVTSNTTLSELFNEIFTFFNETVTNFDVSDVLDFAVFEFKQTDTQRTIAIVIILWLSSLALRAVLRCVRYFITCRCCRNNWTIKTYLILRILRAFFNFLRDKTFTLLHDVHFSIVYVIKHLRDLRIYTGILRGP